MMKLQKLAAMTLWCSQQTRRIELKPRRRAVEAHNRCAEKQSRYG